MVFMLNSLARSFSAGERAVSVHGVTSDQVEGHTLEQQACWLRDFYGAQ